MRVFLDANILFSACRGAGAIRSLLEMAESEGHILVADPYVETEARRNLTGKADVQSVAVLDALLARMSLVGLRGPSPSPLELDWLDPKDRPVLWAAIDARCDVLVTGDKTHFGQAYGRLFGGVRVCSPAQFFALLQQGVNP